MFAMVLILLAAGRPGFAQSNIEANAGIQYDFSNPGARSRAMGGAFIGLADDATAALTNPAGLTQLAAPEISIEGRLSQFTTTLPFESTMQFGGTVISRDFTSSVGGGSFQSFVYAGRRPWSVAVYRAELVNFESDGFSNGPFRPDGTRRLFPFQAVADVGVTQYGISGAYNLGDTVSVGFGLNFDNASVSVRTDRFDFTDFFDPSAASFEPDDLENYQTQLGDESDVGYTAGVRWHTPDETFSVGAVYKSGTQFALRVLNVDPDTDEPFTEVPGGALFDQGAAFHVPSRFGVGVAWKHQTLSVLFDYNRIQYSELTEDLAILFFASDDIPTAQQAFQMEDGNEIRAGAEWGIPAMGSSLIFVRGGLWLDPSHQLTWDGQGLDFSEASANTDTFKRVKPILS